MQRRHMERLDLDLLIAVAVARRAPTARIERLVLEHLGAAHQPAEHLARARTLKRHPVGVVVAPAKPPPTAPDAAAHNPTPAPRSGRALVDVARRG